MTVLSWEAGWTGHVIQMGDDCHLTVRQPDVLTTSGVTVKRTAVVMASLLIVPALGSTIAIADPACTISGTAGNDSLVGTAGPDVICGLSGNDSIWGLAGADYIVGGPGDDRIFGNEHADEIYGNDGADHIEGGKAKDTMFGGVGDDTIYVGPVGSTPREQAFGQDGNDQLFGAEATLFGNGGDDILNLCGTVNSQAYGDGGPGTDIARGVPTSYPWLVNVESIEPTACP